LNLATENLKGYESPGIDHILAELIQAKGITLYSEICNIINSIWKKEELLQQGKGSIIVPIYKKGDKTDSNYRGKSLLPTTYKILSNILVSRLTLYKQSYWGSSVWILS
jgi:hypothetical protein